jgi:HK97 family phage portal protein
MNQIEKLWGAIGGWIGSVFGGGNDSTPIEKVAIAQMAAGTLMHQYEGDEGLQELIQGTVSDCLTVRATERGQLKFIVKVGGSVDNEIAIMLQSLLDNPNVVQPQDEFIEMASNHFDANGNVFIQLIYDDEGMPCEQWIMPSNYVAPRFDSPENPVPLGYQWKDGRAIVTPDQLVIMRKSNIKTSPYKGRGVLLESSSDIKLLNLINRSQENFFNRGGAPNVAIEIDSQDGDMSQESVQLWQDRWNQRYNGPQGTTNIAFIPAGAKVQNFGAQEMNYNASKQDIQNDICQHFQVPYMMLGDVGDANFNNGQVAVALFERNVVLRFGQKMASAYQFRFKANVHPLVTVEVDPKVIESFTQLSPINGLSTTPATPATTQEPYEADS